MSSLIENVLVSVLAVGLAVGYLLTAWLHGSIFSTVIQYLKDGELQTRTAAWLGDWTRPLTQTLTELLLCPLCLSPYVCTLIFVVLWFAGPLADVHIAWLCVSVFASARVALFAYRQQH